MKDPSLRALKRSMFTTGAVYAAAGQARQLVPQTASKDKHRWVLGTAALGEGNEINLLEFDEDEGTLECCSTYHHSDGQVWAMETSPRDSSLLITSHQNSRKGHGLSLFRMPGQSLSDINSGDGKGDAATKRDLIKLQSIESTIPERRDPAFVTSVKWSPHDERIIATKESTVSLYSVTESSVKMEDIGKMDLRIEAGLEPSKNKAFDGTFSAAAWDPHANNSAAVVCDAHLHLVDTRSMSISHSVQAHRGSCRDVDYNPNKPQSLITAGDDRKIRFWDVRNLKEPVRTLLGHGHWVWCAKHNPFHDQLVLSGGSDNRVNLWRVASCSSSPWLGGSTVDEDDVDSSDRRSTISDKSKASSSSSSSESAATDDSQSLDPPDIKIKALDCHTESVYSVAWSPADAWVYCSLSLDGRVYLNHVPAAEKYKLLL